MNIKRKIYGLLLLLPLFAFADNLELIKAIKQVVIESKNPDIKNNQSSTQNNASSNLPLVIPEAKEDPAKKKYDDDQADSRLLESKLKLEQGLPRPTGYSVVGKKVYAYLNVSKKIFKVAVGDMVAGYRIDKITRDYVEVKAPFEANSKSVKLVYDVASIEQNINNGQVVPR